MVDTEASRALTSPLVLRARDLALQAHSDQFRKGGDRVPYFTHLESVVERLVAHGHCDEIELASAYLHDLLEDRPAFAEELRSGFPKPVVVTVELLTERKLDAFGNKRPKAERFAESVQALAQAGGAARFALAVSCADKLDNLVSLCESEREGKGLMTRLNTRPGQYRIQYKALRVLYSAVVRPSLLAAYDAAAQMLFDYLERWLPGRAVAIAAEAHLGQFDKAGAPYILHPITVMQRATSLTEKTVAVLHDVVEDSHWSLEQLAQEGFGPEVIAALDCLTRRAGETYDEFIDRIVANPLAVRIKLLDLEHNLDPSRLPPMADRCALEPLFERYRRARARLERMQVPGTGADKV